MIDFPTSPVIGQQYEYLGRIWQWNGDGWRRVINQGQVVAVFATPGTEVIESATALPLISGSWATLNYV